MFIWFQILWWTNKLPFFPFSHCFKQSISSNRGATELPLHNCTSCWNLLIFHSFTYPYELVKKSDYSFATGGVHLRSATSWQRVCHNLPKKKSDSLIVCRREGFRDGAEEGRQADGTPAVTTGSHTPEMIAAASYWWGCGMVGRTAVTQIDRLDLCSQAIERTIAALMRKIRQRLR